MSPSVIQHVTTEPLCQVVTPVGMMGYGFAEDQVEKALKELSKCSTPTALILDGGSTDSGPSKLALGSTTCPRSSYVRDFRKLLRLSVQYKVPLLISSAGGDGSDDHVDLFLQIIREIAEEPDHEQWKLKTLAVYSEISKEVIVERLKAGQITGCGDSVPALTEEAISKTPRVVAQMGPEPLLDAINAHPDFNVLISGRAYDVAPFVAFITHSALQAQGLNHYGELSPEELGSFTHMGKILECGGLCATPKGTGAQGIVNKDLSFDIKPLDPMARCTALSVAAHTLYEKTRPDKLVGPGGFIDLANTTFTQLEDLKSVRVRGSIFHSSRVEEDMYTVKLEVARVAGFRTLIMGSFRDPILIPQIYPFLDGVKQFAGSQHTHISEKWDIGFHVYGFNAHDPQYVPSEVFIVAEVIAESQDVATSLASTVRVRCAHGSYPNQKATSGSFAMGIGGIFELETKECAEFSVYHLMSLSKGEEGCRSRDLPKADTDGQQGFFTWEQLSIGNGKEFSGVGLSANDSDGPLSTLRALDVAKSNADPQGEAKSLKVRPKTLIDAAKVVRSKNSGPYEITLDVMFDSLAVYQAIKRSGILCSQVIAQLFGIDESDIVWAGFFDVAMAFKATVPRKRRGEAACSGGYLEDDVHGSQQYIPLTRLSLPEDLQEELAAL